MALVSSLQVLLPIGNITALTGSIQNTGLENLNARVNLSCDLCLARILMSLCMDRFRVVYQIETVARWGLMDEVLKRGRLLAILI